MGVIRAIKELLKRQPPISDTPYTKHSYMEIPGFRYIGRIDCPHSGTGSARM